jgi:hypothetical protein
MSLTICTLRADEFRNDPRWHAVVAELVRPKYEDATAFLARDFARCDTLHLGFSQEGETLCAFMTAREEILLPGGARRPALFLGLSAAHERVKNRGVVGHLYRHVIAEAVDWERRHGADLLLWGTTATPTVFLGLTHFLPETEPGPDGCFSAAGAVLAAALCRHLGLGAPSAGDHPFLLRGVAARTLYSEAEHRRIDDVCRRKRFSMFRHLGLDERRHDRLLFVSGTRNNRVRLGATRPSSPERPSIGPGHTLASDPEC